MDKNVGDRIRFLREAQKYTREAFAEKIDISTKFLYEIETGRKGFSADILYRTANELSVSCEYIMTGKDFKYNESLIYILKSLKPKQIAHIREILMLLYNICDTF